MSLKEVTIIFVVEQESVLGSGIFGRTCEFLTILLVDNTVGQPSTIELWTSLV